MLGSCFILMAFYLCHVSFSMFSQLELDFLEELYISTNGSNWDWRNATYGSHWNFTGINNPCLQNWQGISCSVCNCTVESLSLVSYNLVGTLPESIGNMSSLLSLSLDSNKIYGSIPRQLAYIPTLTFVSLADNRLSGDIPSELLDSIYNNVSRLDLSRNFFGGLIPTNSFQNRILKVLNLTSNLIRGTIPESFSNFATLMKCSMGFNYLYGPIPENWSQLTELEILELHNNSLSGEIPEIFSGMEKLHYLVLAGNHFNGTLPSSLGYLTSLRYLDVGSNQLDGTLLTSFSSFENLECLFASYNKFSGEIPQLPHNLFALDLRFNKLSGSILTQISAVDLKYILLGNNHLNGTLPSSLFDTSNNIDTLDLALNDFSGTLPSSLFSLISTLQYIDLSGNRFSGSLPDTIGQLQSLLSLNVEYNRLNGSIPVSIANLTFLEELVLSFNTFSGGIPEAIYDLTALKILALNNLALDGTISSSIGGLRRLEILSLSNASLYGKIPNSFDKLRNLTQLFLDINRFSGSFPQMFYDLPSLIYLSLGYNNFTGNLSSQITNLRSLKVFAIQDNGFSGSLPKDIGNMSSMLEMNIQNNNFSGYIPETFCNLSYLRYFRGYSNRFTGTLPSCLFDSLRLLVSFSLYNNSIHGAIPEVPRDTNLLAMTYLDLGTNHLDGTLPVSLGNFKLLHYFYVSYNSLKGSLPASLCNMTYMTDFYIEENAFTGTLPICFSNWSYLEEFNAHNNILSGKVPPVSLFPKLSMYYIYRNHFTGSVSDILKAATILHSLAYVDIGGNFFTGSLPASFFKSSPALQVFSVASNCIIGTLPSDVCEATGLISFILDGMNTASTCRVPYFSDFKIFGFRASTFSPQNYIQGSIPSCYFAMPNLQTLSLSGLSISGKFPNPLNLTNSLKDLILSYNMLSGDIPVHIQGRLWNTLDLSFNRFGGTLMNDFPSYLANGSLSLNNNRLSGLSTPSALVNMNNISILTNNIFGCDDKSQLPQQDPDFTNYLCGSDALNYPIYAWLVAAGLWSGIVLGILTAARCFKYNIVPKKKDCSSTAGLATDAVYEDSVVVNPLEQPSFASSEISTYPQESIIVGSSIRSSSKKRFSNALENNASSLAYSGVEAGKLSADHHPLVAYLYYLSHTLDVWMRVYTEHDVRVKQGHPEMLYFGRLATALRKIVLLTFTFVLVLLPAYFGLSYFYGIYSIQFIWIVGAIFLSGFVAAIILFLLWTFFLAAFWIAFQKYIFRMSKELVRAMSIVTGNDSLEENKKDTGHHFARLLTVLLINFMINLTVDSVYVFIITNRRYNTTVITLSEISVGMFKVFWNDFSLRFMFRWVREIYLGDKVTRSTMAAAASNSIVSYPIKEARERYFLGTMIVLNSVIIPCLAIAAVSKDCFYNFWKQPPNVVNQYSYASCTSTRYVAADNIGATCVSGDSLDVHSTSYSPPFVYSYQCSSQFIVNYSPVYACTAILIGVIMPMLKIIYVLAYDYYEIKFLEYPNALFSRGMAFVTNNVVEEYLKPPSNAYFEQQAHNAVRFFDKDRFIMRMNSILCVFITFGVIFPPLAALELFSLFSITYSEQVFIGRLYTKAAQLKLYHYQQVLERECKGTFESLFQTIWLLLPLASCFYGFFLFDIYGDDVGLRALWLCVFMALMPVISSIIWKVVTAINSSSAFDYFREAATEHGAAFAFPSMNWNRSSVFARSSVASTSSSHIAPRQDSASSVSGHRLSAVEMHGTSRQSVISVGYADEEMRSQASYTTD
jgi:Leucine-rich repeat (LRR) protein